MMLAELTFRRPELWPLLAAVAVLGYVCWSAWRGIRRRALRRYGAELVERARRPAARAATWSLLGALLVLTWMEPLLGERKIEVERRGVDVVFCLDVSRSMLARDIEPDRLQRAKRDVRSVLGRLVRGDRAALVAFAGEARLVVPLTHDLDSLRRLLDEVGVHTVRTGGSNLAAAVRKALEVAEPQGESTTVIVVLTDGEDLAGEAERAAREVAERGIVLHAVGYGSPRGSKILIRQEGEQAFLVGPDGKEVVTAMHPESLRAMAAATGGEFVRADAMALPLVELYEKRIEPMTRRAYESGEEITKESRFQWVLLPALMLLLVEIFSWGGRRR